MEVFGFMRIQETVVTRGGSKLWCCPDMPLEYAGWSKTYKGFVAELAWSTEAPIWQLDPQRAALIARCESLCAMDAVELLSVGRRLGAVGRDSRLRHAMNVLHLKDNQLAVPMDEKDLPVYRMRWLEVLDHLISIRPYTRTRDLHAKLCLLENTVSTSIMRRWMNKQTWPCAPCQMVVGDRSQPWSIDLCRSDLGRRVLASRHNQTFCLVVIDAPSLTGLQDPDPGMVQVEQFSCKSDLAAALEAVLVSTGNNNAKDKLPKNLAASYRGQPVASALLGLKPPCIVSKTGELTEWELPLHVSTLRPADQTYLEALLNESPADLGLPLAAFRYSKSCSVMSNDLPQEKSMAQAHVARLHTMPGGLMRSDLPAVSSRSEEQPPKIKLYHPLNPFKPSA